MSDIVIAKKGPFPVEVTAGRTYFWCVCGRSAKQPFCDGSHKGTVHAPMAFEAKTDETVFFCGCKYSGRKPTCDGSHKRL